MSDKTAVIFSILILAVFVTGVVIFFRRSKKRGGIVHLSHLRCPVCGREFDYAWIPGVSLTAIRLFRLRYFACPNCGKVSAFDIWNTQVDPDTHNCGNIRIGPL